MSNQSTEITADDIDQFVNQLMKSEIKQWNCLKCNKLYIISYGQHLQECDECYFSRFDKKDVEAFCRRFF